MGPMVKARKNARRKPGRQEPARPSATAAVSGNEGRHTMPKVERNPEIAEAVPWSERVTAYDEEHFVVYLRLLDATADGASDDEMSRIVLGIDPAREPERARKALKSHLERARWMTKKGYRDLLQG